MAASRRDRRRRLRGLRIGRPPGVGDYWSETRLSAPLLALVLFDGLRRRDRLSVAVPTAAAAMMLFILPAL